MIEFAYEALNAEQTVTRGQIAAESVSAAVSQLESQGLQILSIQQVVQQVDRESAGGNDKDWEQDEVYLRVAEVLEKREIVAPALAAFAEELPPGRTRRELRKLVAQLEAGATAEQLVDSRGQAASWLLLLGKGSHSQHLICNLFDEAVRENENHWQWKRALIYPACVLIGSLAVLIFLCVSVVPTFISIFDDFQLDLPDLTKVILTLSKAIQRSPVGFTVAVFASCAAAYGLFRFVQIWALPGRIGSLLTTGSSWQVTEMARLTRRLAEALDAGFELPSALRLAAGGQGRGAMWHLVRQLADDAQQADFQWDQSYSAQRLPTSVIHALQAGADGRPSIPLLRQLSGLYSTRVGDRHNWSTGYLAHFAMIGIGLAVATVVLALFLPLVSLVNGLTG